MNPAPISDGVRLTALALAVRLGVVFLSAGRFPPAEDGHFYHVVATRIAEGHGYTWLWPDGAVTYAAHYPIGYPAIVGGLYAVFGPKPAVAMVFSAVLGALAVLAVHRIAARSLGRRGALVAGALVVLHPALVGYAPALMTDGVVAEAMALVGWAAVRAREAARPRLAVTLVGVALGLVALVRPQSLLFAPVLGLLVARGRAYEGTFRWVVLVTLVSVATCLPWTARNCARMGRCTFVSANAGWNLLIGTSTEGHGAWAPLEEVGVPPECRDVFEEASKDHCFRRAALGIIAEAPVRWLALVPAKLAATFDYGGAPGWYLHASAPEHFDKRAKWTLGAVETAYQRLLLLLCLVVLARARGPNRGVRRGLGLAGGAFALLRPAWVAYLALVGQGAVMGRRLYGDAGLCLAIASVALTAATHAVFFGAGRYAMICYPLLPLIAARAFDRDRAASDTAA